MFWLRCISLNSSFIWKRSFFTNVRTKRVHSYFLLKLRTDSIPDSPSFVSLATSYFSSNIISSNVCTNFFCTDFFEVRTDNTQHEIYLYFVGDIYSCWFWTIKLAKHNNFHKWFEKLPLGTWTFLTIFGRKRNCIIFQYGFVYNHRFKKAGGGT